MLLRVDSAELLLDGWFVKQRKRGHFIEICCESKKRGQHQFVLSQNDVLWNGLSEILEAHVLSSNIFTSVTTCLFSIIILIVLLRVEGCIE